MTKTNFDRHLAKHLKDPAFAERFEQAGEAWDIAIQLTQLREAAGLSQSALARKLKTSQQQISRLESPSYEGHSLSMLRRVAEALNARITVSLEPTDAPQVNEAQASYKPKAKPVTRKIAAKRVTKKKSVAAKTLRKTSTTKTKPKTRKAIANPK